jgi:hypothetical protein
MGSSPGSKNVDANVEANPAAAMRASVFLHPYWLSRTIDSAVRADATATPVPYTLLASACCVDGTRSFRSV